jgi:hypothetical protein
MNLKFWFIILLFFILFTILVFLLLSSFQNKIFYQKRICFITAIFGGYENSCKSFVKQTIATDFVCFTDDKNIIANGWEIDTIPYHDIYQSPLDNGKQLNSLKKNRHTFNIAKYYKQAFQNIPRLKSYDVIVWLDGSIEITNCNVAYFIFNKIKSYKIIGWYHESRNGNLEKEVAASENFYRYSEKFWNNQKQPYQNVRKQYETYLKNGYNETFFKSLNIHPSSHFGVWITCFVAFNNKDLDTTRFLDMWYSQTLQYTTQDQVGFSYVSQKLLIIPYTLPQTKESNSHSETSFYIKHTHDK